MGEGIFRRGLQRPETARAEPDGSVLVDVIAATDAPVAVFGYHQVLQVSETAIDTERLGGLPVLVDHNWSVDGIVGRVEGWRVEPAEPSVTALVLTCRITERKAGDAILSGLWRDVSISFSVVESVMEGETEVVTRWKPLEVSFVAVPADAKAQVRSLEREASAPAVPEAVEVAQGAPAPEAEASGGGESPAEGRVAKEGTMEIREVENRAREPEIRLGRDETVTARERLIGEVAEAIRGRGNRSLADAVCRSAAIRGEPLDRGNREAVMRAATHTSGDFPLILGLAANKAALAVWEAAPALRWWEKIGARYDFADGRPVPKVSFEGFGLLPEVDEGDDYPGITASEEGQTLAPVKFGGDFRLTEEMQLADDLGQFGRMLQEAVRAAIRRASAVCLAALTTDTLRDGKTPVHADHANKADTGAAPSAATLAELEGLLLKAEDASGNPIGLPARYLLAPGALRQSIESLYRVTPTDPDDAMTVDLAKEDRLYVPGLTGTAYYLLADDPEVLIYGYLRDHGGPRVTEYPRPEADALVYHLTLWFGAVCGRYQRIAGNAGA